MKKMYLILKYLQFDYFEKFYFKEKPRIETDIFRWCLFSQGLSGSSCNSQNYAASFGKWET